MSPSALVTVLLYDALRAWREIGRAVSNSRERIILALVLAVLLLLLPGMVTSERSVRIATGQLALVALLSSTSSSWAHARRWLRLQEGSAVAAVAVIRAVNQRHLWLQSAALFLFALFAAVVVGVQEIFRATTLAAAGAAWCVGTLLGQLCRYRHRRQIVVKARPGSIDVKARTGDMTTIVALRQMPLADSKRAAIALAAVLGFAQGLASQAISYSLGGSGGLVAGSIAAFASFLFLTRISAQLCSFTLFTGMSTAEILRAHLTLFVPALAGALAALAAFAFKAPGMLMLELAVGSATALIAVLRVMHYRVMPQERANRLMQIQLVPLAVAASFAPPLAPALMVGRLWSLHRAAQKALWDCA